jgi:hypothetical protein
MPELLRAAKKFGKQLAGRKEKAIYAELNLGGTPRSCSSGKTTEDRLSISRIEASRMAARFSRESVAKSGVTAQSTPWQISYVIVYLDVSETVRKRAASKNNFLAVTAQSFTVVSYGAGSSTKRIIRRHRHFR